MLHTFLIAADAAVVDPWWLVFGRLHPLLLHFPIALILIGAAVAVIKWVFRRGDQPSGTVQTCLWAGMVFSGIAVWTGWELGDTVVDGGQTLFLHRWISISVFSVMVVTAVFDVMRRSPRWPWARPARLLSLCLAAILVAIAGHLGAEMKWGEGYLLAPLAKAAAQEAADAASQTTVPTTGDAAPVVPKPVVPKPVVPKPVVPKPAQSAATGDASTPAPTWADVEPLITAKCERCHGADKQKGGLQLVPWASMFEGDTTFWVVMPGDPDASLLLTRVALPPTDDDRMPPEGEGNLLSAKQQSSLRAWITAGALGPNGATPPTLGSGHAPLPTGESAAGTDTVTDASASIADAAPVIARDNPATSLPGPFDQAAEDAVITRLRDRGVRVRPLHLGSPWLELDFARLEPPATDADCDGVGALAGNLWTCSVAGTAMTDAAMATVGTCLELRTLRIDHTSIGDAGVKALANLQKLEVLNCFGTKLTDASIDSIAKLSGLRAVYLGSTDVTSAGLEQLRAKRPGLNVQGNASVPKPAAKPAPEGKADAS
jgi:uncharacterized membrane protein